MSPGSPGFIVASTPRCASRGSPCRGPACPPPLTSGQPAEARSLGPAGHRAQVEPGGSGSGCEHNSMDVFTCGHLQRFSATVLNRMHILASEHYFQEKSRLSHRHTWPLHKPRSTPLTIAS